MKKRLICVIVTLLVFVVFVFCFYKVANHCPTEILFVPLRSNGWVDGCNSNYNSNLLLFVYLNLEKFSAQIEEMFFSHC